MLLDLNCNLDISIPPSSNIKQGIIDYLSSYKSKYTSQLDGVVLSFKNTLVTKTTGRIIYDSPFCHFPINTTFTVFRPELGSLLDGIVNKVSSDHIGLLILGHFNASIPADQIRKSQFSWDPELYQWSTAGPHSIKPNTVVRFSTKQIIVAHEMISIVGSLTDKPNVTGIIDIDVPENLSTTLLPSILPFTDYSVEEEPEKVSAKRKSISDESTSDSEIMEKISKKPRNSMLSSVYDSDEKVKSEFIPLNNQLLEPTETIEVKVQVKEETIVTKPKKSKSKKKSKD